MAAAKISRSPSLGSMSSRPMTRTQGILLETMQLVEPKKNVPVPNHLLESKIYCKVAQNEVVQARPAVIHFSGFELGQLHKTTLRLANVSTEVQRMHIIPPQTKYFNIKYTKNDRLVPGLTLDCTVEFYPDEWRYYYDCIRIHTKGEENLVIPIHAYPVMSADDFPAHLTFPAVPVGHKMTKSIPLTCGAPIDFEFQLIYLQPHGAFSVDPMSGVVPANGQVEIMVTFAPTEFSTAHMKLQLLISQFNAKPMVCAITGSSAPGLAKELTEASHQQADESTLDPRCITPVDRARKRRQNKKEKSGLSSPPKTAQEMEYAGIKFPSNLDTPYSVSQVLIQEPGKLRMKDIRQAVLDKKGEKATRQMKEAMFEMAVRQDVYEERQNQLRWQVKLGENPVSSRTRVKVTEERQDSIDQYHRERGDPVVEDEFRRRCTQCTYRRTTRYTTELGSEGVKFDLYSNDTWAVRHAALSRFQQAARKIIIRSRAEKNIKGLRDTILNWGKKKFSTGATAAQKERTERQAEQEGAEEEVLLQVDKVKTVTFPTYAPPNVKDDMAVDALGAVPFKPTEVIVQNKVPYFDLKVPQQYVQMGYQQHNTHDASVNYVPPNLVRPLRCGAEDEMISLPSVGNVAPPGSIDDEAVNEGDLRVEDVTSPEPDTMALVPPVAMFKPIEYPALHIFNPAPGVQVFQPPLPYGETDSDFHLCPLPLYTNTASANPHMATQKRYLDRTDTIRGVMAWKRFPSQGLTSLSNTPTLTNVWVPRWTESFTEDLLPLDSPQLFEGLTEEDKVDLQEDDDEEEEEDGVELTPDMVLAQFPLVGPSAPAPAPEKKKEPPRLNFGGITIADVVMSAKPTLHIQLAVNDIVTRDRDNFPHGSKLPATNVPVSTTGPVPREKREQELEYFLKKKYNRLGGRFDTKVNSLNNLKTSSDLVLK